MTIDLKIGPLAYFTPAAKQFILENQWKQLHISSNNSTDHIHIALISSNNVAKRGVVVLKFDRRRFQRISSQTVKRPDAKFITYFYTKTALKKYVSQLTANIQVLVDMQKKTACFTIQDQFNGLFINLPLEDMNGAAKEMSEYVKKQKITGKCIIGIFATKEPKNKEFYFAFIDDVYIWPPVSKRMFSQIENLFFIKSET